MIDVIRTVRHVQVRNSTAVHYVQLQLYSTVSDSIRGYRPSMKIEVADGRLVSGLWFFIPPVPPRHTIGVAAQVASLG